MVMTDRLVITTNDAGDDDDHHGHMSSFSYLSTHIQMQWVVGKAVGGGVSRYMQHHGLKMTTAMMRGAYII